MSLERCRSGCPWKVFDKKFIQLAGPAVKGAADALDGGVTRVSSKTALVDDIEANPKDVELRQRAGSHS